MQKVFQKMVLSALCIFATISTCFICTANDYERVTIETDTVSESRSYILEITSQTIETTTIEKNIETEELLSKDEIELIALVTMAEAEGECEEGKRLVIDTILNRVDSEHFPNTVREVIYQPSQFSSMWNGRVERCEVSEDIYQLVKEELKTRTNSDVIFFTAGEYSTYGEPMFQVENHYFSSYD